MRKMKDSGVPWIGEIPDEWVIANLKRVCEIQGGVGFPIEEQGDQDEEIPFYKVGDLELSSPDGVVLARPKNSISFETAKILHAKIIKENSIVYAKIGAALLLNRRRIIVFPSIIDNNMSSVHPYDGYYFKWLYFLMCCIDFSFYVNPGTVPALSEGSQGKISIPIPPQEKQYKIASYLDAKCAQIDATIASIHALIDKLKEYKQSVITEAVTKGLDPGVPMKDSGVPWIGEIPEEWENRRLRFLCSITTGNKDTVDNNPDGEYPFFVRSPKIEKIDTYSFDGEAILMAGDGVGAGKVFHYYIGKFDYHQRVYNFYNFKYVIGKFLYYYLSVNFIKKIEEATAKSTVDSVRLPMLLDFPIVFGSISVQEKIVSYLNATCARIDAVLADKQALLDKLAEYKKSLIFECVTGKREVPA